MYGLVNQAMKDMVVDRFGESAWSRICERAAVADDDFVAMQPYPDSMTYGLVGAASEVLGHSVEQLLRGFGDYWITFTAQEGYGDMMALFGSDFISCLKNLNGMHAHMGVMMPELKPPRFEVEGGAAGVFQLKYFSSRQGLAPFVLGLLEGLARKFEARAEFQHLPRGAGEQFDTFEIRLKN